MLHIFTTQRTTSQEQVNRVEALSKHRQKKDARGNQKGSLDRTRRPPTGLLCRIVWGSPMGFYSTSFRFEGGGRRIIGLKRSGKSCRLRWVNYLNPGLKRGKMTPHEEKLVLELHSQWGNSWSRIARRLPGRTDNEIKNYWRTFMRKKAQEKKRVVVSPSLPSSNFSSSSSSSDYKLASLETATGSLDDAFSLQEKAINKQEVCSMDDIWKDITSCEEPIKPLCEGRGSKFGCAPLTSTFWEYCTDTPWKMDDEEESKMFFSINDPFLPC